MSCEEEVRKILRDADDRNLREFVNETTVIRYLVLVLASRIDALEARK